MSRQFFKINFQIYLKMNNSWFDIHLSSLRMSTSIFGVFLNEVAPLRGGWMILKVFATLVIIKKEEGKHIFIMKV